MPQTRTSDKKRQMRIDAARDTINTLLLGVLRAQRGFYVQPRTMSGGTNPPNHKAEAWLQSIDARRPKGKYCEVCAIGGLFVSLVRKHDDLDTPGPYVYASMWTQGCFVKRYARRFFSDRQLRLIEIAFEGDARWRHADVSSDDDNLVPSEEALVVACWARGVYDHAVTMVCIMDNIIAHRGTFNPAKPLDTSRYAVHLARVHSQRDKLVAQYSAVRSREVVHA